MKKEKRQSNNKKNKPSTMEKDSKKILFIFFFIGIPFFTYFLMSLVFSFKCLAQGSHIKLCQVVDKRFMQNLKWGMYLYSILFLGFINRKIFYKHIRSVRKILSSKSEETADENKSCKK